MRLFHRTTEQAAEAILKKGFGLANTNKFLAGVFRLFPRSKRPEFAVWLSDVPLGEPAEGLALLQVDLELSKDEVLSFREWPDRSHREFLISADVLNLRSRVRRLTCKDE